MGECKTISMEELKRNNPRLCLSALRVFGNCYKCDHYLSKSGVPCDSRIVNKKGEALIQRKENIKKEIKSLKEELSEVD